MYMFSFFYVFLLTETHHERVKDFPISIYKILYHDNDLMLC